MLNDLAMLKNMSAMAKHASRRHTVIAENIANADTPGYKAKDVKPFSEIYAQSIREERDVAIVSEGSALILLGGPESVDGNTVSLEGQMLTSAEAVGDHEMALALYRKTLDLMKMAINKNS
ncbi:MAG: flagellar basal body rod protein FlgB [Robiginitomaculum sp.]|nr:MAG: flagellar basal body rod protein FlgB [Robiginitomaculum sp.]